MSVCLHCHADLPPGARFCAFCSTAAPRELARLLRSEAISFLAQNHARTEMHLGPRARSYSVARSLRDLGALRVTGRRGTVCTYAWTDYGRALCSEAAAA